ncbi:polyketide synthase [Microbispora rosea subsp. aerata]|nr:acyl carrier protein [Microbispora rosea]GGO28111.1 polyketide synthase [Microbispora rosea subsp. aerata]GIH56184.1 polyketide synthase [Microbispora rosea subsp. aerata]GLJ85749.1 polyketide synthase [Microbispora rosea subsp. aerata]
MTTEVPTVVALESWLRDRVATYGEVDPSTFTEDTPLTELGFSSVYALTLCGDIEDTFGVDVEPTIVWDNPTIRRLAAALHELIAEN